VRRGAVIVCGSRLVQSAAADSSRAEMGTEFALHMADTAMARIFSQVDHRVLLRPFDTNARYGSPAFCILEGDRAAWLFTWSSVLSSCSMVPWLKHRAGQLLLVT